MKLLDSTFLIDLLQGKKETLTILNSKDLLLTTQVNMYEVMIGLYTKKWSKDKIHEALDLFDNIKVLPLDDAASKKAAEISATLILKGETIQDCDCLIGGIALSKGITTIVTRNTKDFKKIKGLNVEPY